MPRRWRGTLTIEGLQTGDGRVFAPNSVEWVDPPLPLAWMRDGDQHVNLSEVAPQVGVIDTISRDGSAIPGAGIIDDANEDGAEIIRRMEAGTAPLGNRFPVSVDPDNWEVELIMSDPESDEGEMVMVAAAGRGPLNTLNLRLTVTAALRAAAGDPDPGDDGGEDGVVMMRDACDMMIERFTRLRLRGATLCSVAAWDNVWIELEPEGAEGEDTPPEEGEDEGEMPMVAAAPVAVPAAPPREWFFTPEPDEGDDRLVEQVDGGWAVPLTILDTGQVFGHIARRDQAHRGYSGRYVPPPTSSLGYREFHVGSVQCADGSLVATGPMVVGCDHAPASMALLEARDFYAHSGMGWADGRVVDGRWGPWFSGALRPGLTDEDLRVLRALAPSGDWRPEGGGLEMCAVLSVNVPGFPIARESLAASALPAPAVALSAPRVGLDAEGGLSSLVAAGMVTRCSECAERERERQAMAAGLASADAVLAALGDLRANVVAQLARLERRTRHLEPIAASAMVERVHANGR